MSQPRNDSLLATLILAVVAICTLAFWLDRKPPNLTAPPTVQPLVSNTPGGTPQPPRRNGRSSTILDVSNDPNLTGLNTTRITVDLDNQPTPAAANALSLAAGLIIETPTPPNPQDTSPITLHLRDAPFLEALLQLRDQSAMPIREARPNGFLLAGPNGHGVGAWCISGPFAFIITRIESVADLSSPTPTPNLTLSMETLAEPQIKVLLYPSTAAINTLIDDKQQDIHAEPSRDSTPSAGGTGGTALLTLHLPPNPGRRIALFHGSALFTIAAKTEPFATEALTEPHTQTVAGIIIHTDPLIRIAGGPPHYTLRVRYNRAACPPERWAQFTRLNFALKPRLFNAAGEPFTLGITAINTQEDVISLTYDALGAASGGDAHHLILELPSELRNVRVPFEFKDLLLPS